MTGVIAVIPVKRFADAKRRAAEVLGDEERRAVVQAMLSDVLAAVSRCKSIAGIIVVTGEPAAARLAARFGADVLDDPDDAGHSEAAGIGQREAARRGAAAVLLLPGDCPMLDPAEVDGLVGAAAAESVAVVPDRHGSGTNALLISPPKGLAPSFGAGSRERHLESAEAAGLDARIADIRSLALDLDTADDLRALAEAADDEPSRCPATAATLRHLGHSGAS